MAEGAQQWARKRGVQVLGDSDEQLITQNARAAWTKYRAMVDGTQQQQQQQQPESLYKEGMCECMCVSVYAHTRV